eukprot:g10671.t1
MNLKGDGASAEGCQLPSLLLTTASRDRSYKGVDEVRVGPSEQEVAARTERRSLQAPTPLEKGSRQEGGARECGQARRARLPVATPHRGRELLGKAAEDDHHNHDDHNKRTATTRLAWAP